MIDQNKLTLFSELFDRSKTVLIIFSADALRDHLFAATALYKTFKLSTDKEVLLLSSKDLSKNEADIVYLDETKTEIGNKNLCISLDYEEDGIEKISYHINQETKKFYLTIKPKNNIKPPSSENVEFFYTGAEADMIILVGVDELESLEQLYFGYESLYQSTALVSINSYETAFGNLKIDVLGSSCVSEYVSDLLYSLNYQPDSEVATNLLAGIDEETDKLQSYLATAETFEIVAKLLKSGARRFARKDHNQTSESQETDITIEPNSQQPQDFLIAEQVEPSDDTSINDHTQIKEKNGTKSVTRAKRLKPKTTKRSDKPKVGDLNYTPSGFSPSSGG